MGNNQRSERGGFGDADNEHARVGRYLEQPGLGRLLREIGDEGSDAFYRGLVAGEMARTMHLTEDALAGYRPVERSSLGFGFAGHTVLTTPRPARGGERLRMILEALGPQSSTREVAWAIRDAASDGGDSGGHTVHVSCMDGAGNAASLTISLGVGCAVPVPGTEVMLSNALGEPGVARGDVSPGERLSSFMAPTVVLDGNGRARMALGSPGSSRIPPAVAQVLFRRLVLGEDLEEAVKAPRVHAAGESAYAEPGALDGAEGVMSYERLDSFFGGVNAVERADDGSLREFADPRRGGGISYL
jgi:gamma-glutamyltranspeptidase/glutathione hydrolase